MEVAKASDFQSGRPDPEEAALDRATAEYYRSIGLPNHAEHLLKFGMEGFGKYYTGPRSEREQALGECVRKGVPWKDVAPKPPKGALYD